MNRWLVKQNQVPPWGYRAMADSHGKYWPVEYIVQRSGLSRSAIMRLSLLKSWERVPVGTMAMFIHGCGFEMGKLAAPLRKFKTLISNGVSRSKQLKLHKGSPLWKKARTSRRLDTLNRILLS